ncbi:MAG: tetratricopeptide repeat protein [Acidobacteriota bacterium]|jgi:tetratricopeptide (TPR) repeat protein|nr:tetratricopeptide repeat protein [Acidobacteriota bacterium]
MKRYVFIYPLCLLLVSFGSIRSARADYKQAVTYYSQGNYNKAIQELKPDLDKSPNWEFGHRLLGLCYLGINNNALAVSSLARAAELKSTAFSTYYGLGQAYFNMQRYGDAIASMNRAEPLATKEKNPEAEKSKISLVRGSAYYRSSRYADAVEDLRNAIHANSSDWTLHSMLGISYFNLNRTDEAIQTLEKALSLKPGEGAAQISQISKDILGKAYLKKGVQALSGKQYAAAVQSLTKAKSYNPDDGYINYNLAEAYLFQQQYPAAEKALTAASTRLPDNAGVFTRLGLVYEKQSKRDLALKAYKKAYELNPSPELKEAVDRLSKKK